jgi:DNA-binding IclR family transcriptional regulator
VRRLDVESISLPLLFFKGGYGRFAPLSLAAAGRGLITQLRDVDLVRPEMDRIAADIPGARCNASALVDDEIVVLASAGELGSMSPATFVGERLPFIPPLGRVFAAWMDDAGLENWLKHLLSEDARAAEREWLASVSSHSRQRSRPTSASSESRSSVAMTTSRCS